MRENFIKQADRRIKQEVRNKMNNLCALPRLIEFASPIFNTLNEIVCARPAPEIDTTEFHWWYHFGNPKNHYWGSNYKDLYICVGWIKGKSLKFGKDESCGSHRGKPENFTQLLSLHVSVGLWTRAFDIYEVDDYRSTEWLLDPDELGHQNDQWDRQNRSKLPKISKQEEAEYPSLQLARACWLIRNRVVESTKVMNPVEVDAE